MTLEGRVALVTGGGRGIGRAISIALAEDGADVVVNYRKDNDAADEVVAEITQLGRRGVAVQGSVDSLDDVRRVAEEAVDALGPVDILVHNAGIASRGNSVAKTEPEELDTVMRTHALGPFWLTGLILPGMRTKPRGDVVFISSNTTRAKGMPGGAPYHMGKHAMEALAFTLAKEERGKGW
jgi:NAD(P)-dependent dehydrogenase (short-subunit alcohol dehydrogenase family)